MTTIDELLDALNGVDGVEGYDLIAQLRGHDALASLEGPAALRAARGFVAWGEPPDLSVAGDLAYRAHQSGVPEAGILFAECADRIAMLTRRPQRFGTISMQHQGDAVMAPVDPSVPDEMRLELGLPTLAGLRERIEEANRVRARERAATPGLADQTTFARVWRDPTEPELRARWEREGEPVWADGDELTFVCDRPLAGAIVGPIFELPMWRAGDLLTLSVRVERLAEAVLTYGFWPLTEDGRPAFAQRPDPDGRWRGPDAPAAAPSNNELVGSLIDAVVESEALGEPRRVVVYRPPNASKAEELPVVYATDGGMFAPYARRLDAAMAAGTIPRAVVVAAHSAGWDPARGGNLRGMEYLMGFDERRFDRHQRFFVDELPRWAEAELGVSADPERRAVFGCSDGGAHAMSIALLHHERFRHVIAYSSGVPPVGRERWPEGRAPHVQLAAGILEPPFFGATQAWHHWLDLLQIPHHWTERVCGHEPIQWVEMLPDAVGRAFAAAG